MAEGSGHPGPFPLASSASRPRAYQWKDATRPERERFERIAALARFFGGGPRTGGAAASRAPRKKKEGC
jgi:hypothetical protein